MSAEIFKLYYPLFMEVDLFGTLIVLVLLFRLIIDSRIRGQREFRRLLVWEVILFISEALSEGLLNLGVAISMVKIVDNQQPDVIVSDDFEEWEES